MITLTPSIIALVATSVICQVIGASLMPMTKGLTEIIPTIGFGIAFTAGLGIMARLIHSGINLSALLPFMAAVVPLCAIVVGITVLWRVRICVKNIASSFFVPDNRSCEQHALRDKQNNLRAHYISPALWFCMSLYIFCF